MATVITESEILEVLAQAARGQEETAARTVEELHESTGIRPSLIRKALRQHKAAGRLVLHHVLRERLDGTYRPVPAYTIAAEEEA